MKNSNVFVLHILDSIVAINLFLGDLTKELLEKDRLKQNAVIRELEIIGEAVKNLPESIKLKYSAVPWKQISGMRDKLIHHYFGVDLDIVWNTIKEDLPILEGELKKLLNDGV